jgi:sporulation protein YabP
MQNNENNAHSLTLDLRKKLTITGVDSVDGFSEQTLKLSVKGEKLFVYGNDIKITSFNKANGNLSAEGDFIELKYQKKKDGILKKVFK